MTAGLTTTYTDDQTAAIDTIDEPLQIIACAGSGKTQVISQRIAKILGQPGIEPRNVIAFTFTEKAAAELKERVLGILQEERGEVTGLAEMYIGTMHGYTLDLLQRLVPDTFKYSVLTEITSRLLIDKYSKQAVWSDHLPHDRGQAEPSQALAELPALLAGPRHASRRRDR